MNSTDFRQTAYNRPFIPQRADPYILHRDGRYYFTASVPEYDRIVLRRSDTLEGLASAPESIIWTRWKKRWAEKPITADMKRSLRTRRDT